MADSDESDMTEAMRQYIRAGRAGLAAAGANGGLVCEIRATDPLTGEEVWSRRVALRVPSLSDEAVPLIPTPAQVRAHAERAFGDAEKTRGWMEQPHHALNGQTPSAALATQPGAIDVDALLTRVEHGVHG